MAARTAEWRTTKALEERQTGEARAAGLDMRGAQLVTVSVDEIDNTDRRQSTGEHGERPGYIDALVAAFRTVRPVPPAVAYSDLDGPGLYRLFDGNHRVTAAREAGVSRVPVLLVPYENLERFWDEREGLGRLQPELVNDPARDALAAWPFPDSTDYFASGSNSPDEIRALAGLGRGVGVAVPDLSEAAIRVLEHEVSNGYVQVFVDSGAFSEVKFGPGGPTWPKPITDAEWKRRLAIYERLARALGKQLYAVAPDRIGDQRGTLERQAKYAAQVASLASHGANILVPVQKGATPMAQFYGAELGVLLAGVPKRLHRQYYPAIPLKKGATSLTDVEAFARVLPKGGRFGDNPPRVHFLGRGVYAPTYRETFAAVLRACPEARITSDSVLVRANVGKGRPYTAAQHALKDVGVEDAGTRKRVGLGMALAAADAVELVAALEAGWYDSELFDSAQEHLAWLQAGQPEPDEWERIWNAEEDELAGGLAAYDPSRTYWDGKIPVARSRWGYHATFVGALESIRRFGLVPREESGAERRAEWEDEDAVYFLAPYNRWLLAEYGPVFLRFPHPTTWKYNTGPNPDLSPVYEAITDRVAPEQIEVLTRVGEWRKLQHTPDADAADADDDDATAPEERDETLAGVGSRRRA